MNQELVELYETHFKNLVKPLTKHNSEMKNDDNLNDCATNPFLIKTSDDYNQSKNRIMIFGQETNCWGSELGNDSVFANDIQKSIEIYDEFFYKGGINSYGGPFWSEFKRIKREIENEFEASFIWNNINKIGRIGKGNYHLINDIQFQYFKVVKQEILLTKPNILILFTGFNYDEFIEQQIGAFKRVKITENVCFLKFENDLKDLIVINTFHPNALYMKSINREVIPTIIDEIKKVCQ